MPNLSAAAAGVPETRFPAAGWLLPPLALALWIAPYITLTACCGLIAAVMLLRQRPSRRLNLAAFLILTLISTVPLATKTLEPRMNDKVNYYLEMQNYSGYSLTEWLAQFSGADFLSHLLFKLSAMLFGSGNAAFAAFFILSFSLLALGVYRLTRVYFVVILFLFCCQYNFQGLYGNLLRQGLALSFLVLATAERRRAPMLLWIMLASLSHFSSYLFLPFLLLPARWRTIGTLPALAAFAACYLGGALLMPKLLALAGNDFLATRAEAYVSGSFGNNPLRKIQITLLYIGVVEALYQFSRRCFRHPDHPALQSAYAVRLMFLYTCAIFFATSGFEEVANRYSFNMMIFVLTFIVIICGQLRDAVSRVLLTLLCFSLGVGSYLYINLIGVQQFWYGDLQALLTDSLPTVFAKLQISGAL
ncbi:EpsG family protein [Serratia rubidaea]|uniref:EpsG family protein n=1 Tax=Serratia rubidaea TaxID=61652 RepID=UPI0023AF9638|nr:EpsG family protein [Serratia rubidaea]MDK1702712.1 EpsG family protein [Serratia rubidaea]